MIRNPSDDRAVTAQIGFILLFAFLLLAATAWQVSVVPDQNQQVEYNHNQQVHDDLQQLRSAVVSPGATNREVPVRLGTAYPDRTLYLNPPPAGGRLWGVSGRNVTTNVTNATAAGKAGDFWNGSLISYDTTLLAYQPSYSEYQNAPTTYLDNTLLYDRYRSANLTRTTQSLVQGNQLSLSLVQGNLSVARSGGSSSVPLRVEPTSSSTNTVTLTNRSGPITLTVTSRLPASRWAKLLDEGGELASDGGYVDGVVDAGSLTIGSERFHRVGVRLVPNESYQLQVSTVTLQRTSSGAQAASPPPAYLLPVEGNESVVEEADDQTVTFEVRDRYGNPIDGTVNVTLDGVGTLSHDGGTDLSNLQTQDGRVTLTYTAPNDVSGLQTVDIDMSLTGDPEVGFDGSAPKNASARLFVSDAGSGGGGGGGGGGGAGGGGSSDSAYITEWDGPSTITVDYSTTQSVTLTARIAEGLANQPISFVVNDSSVVSVQSQDAQTNGTGEAAVTYDLTGRSSFLAYVTGGGTGDRVLVQVLSGAVESLLWETPGDWDAAAAESNVVHENYGDHDARAVQLGYPSSGSGLVAYYPLDENSGSTATDTTGGNDGTVNGAGQGRPGVLNTSSYEFDGVDDAVVGPTDLAPSLGTSGTVSAWVKTTQTGSDTMWQAPGIVGVESNGDGNDVFYGWLDASGNIGVMAGNDYGAQSSTEVNDGRWHHVVLVRDATSGQTRVYVDGVLEDTAASETGAKNSAFASLGVIEDTGGTPEYFDGRLDEVRLYDRAISDGEARALYEATRNGTLTTGAKTTDAPVDPQRVRLENVSASVPPQTDLTVFLESDPEADGTWNRSAPVTIVDGQRSYAVGDGSLGTLSDRFRLVVEMNSTHPGLSPCLSGVEVKPDGSSGQSVSTACPSDTASGAPPTADFTTSPADPSTADDVQFDASGSSDPDGSIDSFLWDFDGDGTVDENTTSATTTHLFVDNGTYDVTLTVVDVSGATDTVTQSVQVENVAPSTSPTATTSDPTTADDISFVARASDQDGSVVGYQWDFGDGSPNASVENPSHAYDTPGTYTITLTVTDDDGATTTASTMVTVDRIRVAVVDDSGGYGDQVVSALAQQLPTNYSVVQATLNEVTANPDAYEVVVAQDLPSDGTAVQAFVDATDDRNTAVVYLDQWSDDGYNPENSNAISELSATTGNPSSTGQRYGAGGSLVAVMHIDRNHPLFDGIGSAGDTFTVHDAYYSDHAWFNGFNNVTLARSGDSNGLSGPAVAVDEHDRTILLASLGREPDVQNDDYTDDADVLLRNAVTYGAEGLAGVGLEPSGPDVGLVGDGTAVDTDGSGSRSAVQFHVGNGRATAVRVTDIRVDPANSNVARLDDPIVGEGKYSSEFYVEVDGTGYTTDFAGGFSVPRTVDLSTAGNANDEPVIPADEVATFSLYQFTDGASNEFDMTCETVQVTLYFSDGTQTAFTVTAHGPTAC
ncbi:PKD domain-containing protein [Haloarchaeobius sp. DFWS5]|uniref:PKD domain-containing protein n=1 Tax=Haloarchaeobius sp. DFWS5 TaxID=3446114 RepID=UPI003EC02DF2